MTRVVIDANVVVKWVLPEAPAERQAPQALALLEAIKSGSVHVTQPPHWLAEVAAVLARLAPRIAERSVALLHAMAFPIIDDSDTYGTACQLAVRLGHHVFDTLYHAVALSRPETLFVTADERYFRKARRLGGLVLLQDFRAS